MTTATLPAPLAATRKVGSRGQVVIEKAIRDALGIEPGAIARQELVGDHVEIRFYPAEHEDSLRGILAPSRKHRVPPEEWEERRRRAWPDAIRARWHREGSDE